VGIWGIAGSAQEPGVAQTVTPQAELSLPDAIQKAL